MDVELMKKEIVAKLNISFEDAAYQEDSVEYWLARDLQVLLNYSKWSNFFQVIEKAKIASRTLTRVYLIILPTSAK